MRRLVPVLLLVAACGPAPVEPAALDAAREAGLCGRALEAADLLAPLVATHGRDARVLLLAGDVATWRDDPDEGLRLFRLAAAAAPNDPAPHLHAAYVLLVYLGTDDAHVAQARDEAAAALLNSGGRESAAYRACRGEIAWIEGDAAAAETWFRGALELDPKCRWALRRLVQTVTADTAEHAALRERLAAVLGADHRGEGMSRGRTPITFCGD